MNCNDIQDRLADDLAAANAHPEVKSHLESCAACRKVAERLRQVDQAMADLPRAAVPDELVKRTVDEVDKQNMRPKSPARLILAIATPVVLILVVGVMGVGLMNRSYEDALAPKTGAEESSSDRFAAIKTVPPEVADGRRVYSIGARKGESYNFRYLERTKAPDHGVKLDELKATELQTASNKDAQDRRAREQDKPAVSLVLDNSEIMGGDAGGEEGLRWSGKKGDKCELSGDMAARQSAVAGQTKEEDHRSRRPMSGVEGKLGRDNLERTRNEGGQGYLKIETRPRSQVYVNGKRLDVDADQPVQLSQGRHRVTLSKSGHQSYETSVEIQSGETRNLRANLVPLADLKFIPARGYFANTYLPGDPEIEWLKNRLSEGIFMDGRLLPLEKASVPYRQPFDAPATAGLAAYLSADRASLEAGQGPTRMTLQVGLKGSERHARRRAALNAALVVDLRQTPPEDTRRILWALADSMASDQQAGDRFTLVVAGAEKPVVMSARDFKPGAVRLSLARTLQSLEKSGNRRNLKEALQAAYQAVVGEGVGDAPIGANLVMLASAAPLGQQSAGLQSLVHQQAVSGVTLSTIGVGARADRVNLGALAQAGQGRRRLVTGMKPAGRVIENELAASGKVVARAVRLRIRLAEGVKLVEVLGSRPLDAVRSERVRQAEKAIDRRVARTLGVKADRGEDEDGIQIVIPAYYAGDDHVILLDVVVPGPGQIADVQVRYKDLVNLDNAVARASLSLPAGHRPGDPLVRNVGKNLLAYRTSRDLLLAGNQLSRGAFAQALATLERAAARIEGHIRQNPGLADDPELVRDQGMLTEYRRVLGDHPRWQNDQRIRLHLSRSLVYAGKVKLPPGAGLVARR